jgi:hypothetical protein
MNFANTNQPITTFPLTNLPSFRLGHQQPEPQQQQQQPDLIEAITTILDSSTWFEEKLEKRLKEIVDLLCIDELIGREVEDAIDNAIRGLDLNDHIDMRDAVKQAVQEELNDNLSDEINNLLENASVTISV